MDNIKSKSKNKYGNNEVTSNMRDQSYFSSSKDRKQLKYTSQPFWFQHKYMQNLKSFKLNFFKLKLNYEIKLAYHRFKNRRMQKILLNKSILEYINNAKYLKYRQKYSSLKRTGLKIQNFVKERIWKKELSRFIYDLKNLCRAVHPRLQFRIFGGIINKIINATFNITEHDIDIYLVFGNSTQLSGNLFNNFLNSLRNSRILLNVSHIKNYTLVESHYQRIYNRPGLDGIEHIKGKRNFLNLGLIDIDILSSPPNLVGVDCTISNYSYNPYNETLKLIKPQNNLIGTLIDNRHKIAKLFFPDNVQGIANVNQILLLKSRQEKYLIQGWNVLNEFKFPEVEKTWECAICYESNYKNTDSQNIITLDCNHKYCKKCIVQMSNSNHLTSKNNCPYCRKLIKVKIEKNKMDEDDPFYIVNESDKLVYI